MSQLAEPRAPTDRPQTQDAAAAKSAAAARADAAMAAYVGYLAGLFDIGQLAAGRRLSRAGVREPLLNDS